MVTEIVPGNSIFVGLYGFREQEQRIVHHI